MSCATSYINLTSGTTTAASCTARSHDTITSADSGRNYVGSTTSTAGCTANIRGTIG